MLKYYYQYLDKLRTSKMFHFSTLKSYYIKERATWLKCVWTLLREQGHGESFASIIIAYNLHIEISLKRWR